MGISITDFDVVYNNEQFSKSASCSETEVINSVSTSFVHHGVNLSFSDKQFKVSGAYSNMYKDASWTYIPLDSTTSITVQNFNELPQKINTLVSGNREDGPPTTVVYTVNTTETVKTYTTETRDVIDPITQLPVIDPITQLPTQETYEQEHIAYVPHSYNITQILGDTCDNFVNQLLDAISRGVF